MRKLQKEWAKLQREYKNIHKLFKLWISRPDHKTSAELQRRCLEFQVHLSQLKNKVNYQYRDLVSQHAHEEEL
jgi:hypothetical protein